VITVNLVEQTAASKKSSANAERNASLAASITALAKLPLGGLNGLDATASDASKFGGKGDAAANNAFTGTITTTVIEVLPNGNLLVSGEKQIAINQGNEFIRFSGIVNPVSVTGANTVQSTQVADARIEYRANGYIDETQQMGWLQRFFERAAFLRNPAMSRLFRLAAACRRSACWPAPRPAPNASRISPASAACATTSWSATAWWSASTAPATRPPRPLHGAEHHQHARQPRRHAAAGPVAAAQERRRGDGHRQPAALRAAGPADRRHRVVDGQRPLPQGRHPGDDALKGVDGQVYAMAQGSLAVSGAGGAASGGKVTVNHLSAGRIPGGATVERSVPTAVGQGDSVFVELNDADFGTAQKVVDAINHGPRAARALDGRQVQVRAPDDVNQRVAFLGRLENLDVTPAVQAAKVIINSRTGSVVMNQKVALQNCAVSHGSLTVTVSNEQQVSQPNPFGRGQTAVTNKGGVDIKQDGGNIFNVKGGTNLADVVKALNALGANPLELIAILQAMKASGALRAELEVI
jgi:hypothetical protein